MAFIVDYQSLTQAIADFAHRADLADGLYTDYFIQTAQAKISNDIFENNFGNGIAAMEVAMQPQTINGGTLVVPTDWFAPKGFQVSDGSSDRFPLIFKAASWLYNAYPSRQPAGLPAYIARDVMPLATFTGTLLSSVLTVISGMELPPLVGTIQIGAPLDDATGEIVNPCTVTGQLSGPAGGVGTYSVASGVAQGVGQEPMTAGGNVFVFGPYPDSAYVVQGVYYSKGTALSTANPTNWLVLQCPEVLHAYSMIEAGKFLKDSAMQQMWTGVAEDFLLSLIERDKAERWAASTMQVECA